MLLRSLVVLAGIALATSRTANAACFIDRLRPEGTLPTMAMGQTFQFVMTDDCADREFSSTRPPLTIRPTMGALAGPGAHWYEVALSASEWASVRDSGVTAFRWAASARNTALPHRPVWIYQTNELDFDRDGWTRSAGDFGRCDNFPHRNPDAIDICGDGIDENCDGSDACPFTVDDAGAVVQGSEMMSASGSTLAVADVNGDGIQDLVIGAPGTHNTGGRVYVSFGPLNGTVIAGDDVTIAPRATRQALGETLAAGDADGDGIGDLLAGSWDANAASLLLGPITGDRSSSTADLQLSSGGRGTYEEGGNRFANYLRIAPDVDGDGGSDIVITAPSDAQGAVYVIPGTTTGSVTDPVSVATYTFEGPETFGWLGVSAIDMGDTDGDGVVDLAMSDPENVYVVPGGMMSGTYDVSDVATATVDLVGNNFSGFLDPRTLATTDHDHDGYMDLVAGDPYARAGGVLGLVHLLSGPFAGHIDAWTDAVARWEGHHVGELVETGDCNGDGETDYLLAGWAAPYLSMGPVSGVIDVVSLPTFLFNPSEYGGSTYGAALFGPDWSGDGVQEIVVGHGFARTPEGGRAAGATYVFFSEHL